MSTFADYRKEVEDAQREIFARGAAERENDHDQHRYYYRALRDLLEGIVEEGKRVLCLRSDIGQYLEWVQPSEGVGVEVVEALTEAARTRYAESRPELRFETGDLEALPVEGTFDYILIVDAINEVFDVQATLEGLHAHCTPNTKLVIVFYNFLWQPMAQLAEACFVKRAQPKQSWLSFQHISHLLGLAGFEPVRRHRKLLWPFNVPGLSWLVNRFLAPLPLLEKLCLIQAVVARPVSATAKVEPATVSVIVPCKNEAGNIQPIVERTPEMGAGTELVFCDDKSTDGTADEVRRMQAEHPERDIRLVEGPGISKADGVWRGFDAARNDILMILDDDIAVPPEELPKFYSALVEGRGEFINGTRMVYPMRDQAMRLANLFGNKVFSLVFTHILGQDISDTLCGTKALWRRDYERMKPLRGSWGVRDRWGDYELIFGAAKLNMKHVDLPIHYMERTYGETKMTGRLKNASVMFRMCLAAYSRLR